MDEIVKNFAESIRSCAEKSLLAPLLAELAELIEKRGRSVGVVRFLPVVPKLSTEEYSARREEAIKKAMILFGIDREAAAKEFPETMEEFLAKNDIDGRIKIPQFKVVFPEDWVKGRDIGICRVPPDAQDSLLAGDNLAGYSRQVRVTADGAEFIGEVIYHTSLPVAPLWRELANTHAAAITMLNISNPSGETADKVAQEVTRRIFKGDREAPGTSICLFQAMADGFIGQLVNEKSGGMLEPIIASFFPSIPPIDSAAFSGAMKGAIGFLARELKVSEPRTELEKIAGDAMLARIVLAKILSVDNYVKLLEKMGLATPIPFLISE